MPVVRKRRGRGRSRYDSAPRNVVAGGNGGAPGSSMSVLAGEGDDRGARKKVLVSFPMVLHCTHQL